MNLYGSYVLHYLSFLTIFSLYTPTDKSKISIDRYRISYSISHSLSLFCHHTFTRNMLIILSLKKYFEMTKPLNQEYFAKDETLGASTNRSFHVFHINLICKFQKCIYKDDLSSKAFCFPPT